MHGARVYGVAGSCREVGEDGHSRFRLEDIVAFVSKLVSSQVTRELTREICFVARVFFIGKSGLP